MWLTIVLVVVAGVSSSDVLQPRSHADKKASRGRHMHTIADMMLGHDSAVCDPTPPVRSTSLLVAQCCEARHLNATQRNYRYDTKLDAGDRSRVVAQYAAAASSQQKLGLRGEGASWRGAVREHPWWSMYEL